MFTRAVLFIVGLGLAFVWELIKDRVISSTNKALDDAYGDQTKAFVMQYLMSPYAVPATIAVLFLGFIVAHYYLSRNRRVSATGRHDIAVPVPPVGELKPIPGLPPDRTAVHDALFSIVHDSAWGRWFAANSQTEDGNTLHEPLRARVAASEMTDAAMRSAITIYGRQRGHIKFEPVHPDVWRLAYIDVEPDDRTLYRASMGRRSELTQDQIDALPDYDSIQVSEREFRRKWPREDRDIDQKTRKLLAERERPTTNLIGSEVRGGDGAKGPGGNASITGPGDITIVGGTIRGGDGGADGGAGGNASVTGGSGAAGRLSYRDFVRNSAAQQNLVGELRKFWNKDATATVQFANVVHTPMARSLKSALEAANWTTHMNGTPIEAQRGYIEGLQVNGYNQLFVDQTAAALRTCGFEHIATSVDDASRDALRGHPTKWPWVLSTVTIVVGHEP